MPIVVDSSRWSVIEAGLKCLQGKGIVNSISLKEGEDVFRAQARKIRRYGAGVIVMAFDEKGQADTVERKVEIATRAYRILTEEVGMPPDGHHHRSRRSSPSPRASRSTISTRVAFPRSHAADQGRRCRA